MISKEQAAENRKRILNRSSDYNHFNLPDIVPGTSKSKFLKPLSEVHTLADLKNQFGKKHGPSELPFVKPPVDISRKKSGGYLVDLTYVQYGGEGPPAPAPVPAPVPDPIPAPVPVPVPAPAPAPILPGPAADDDEFPDNQPVLIRQNALLNPPGQGPPIGRIYPVDDGGLAPMDVDQDGGYFVDLTSIKI
jgi:hypothetical protein